MNTSYRIAVVNGDGIGHEIVPVSLQVLERVADLHNFQLEWETFPWGAGHYLEHGKFMPDDGLEILAGFDAIFFGAVGLKEVDDTLPAMLYTFKVKNPF